MYNSAFENDEKLENIELPSSIKFINHDAFAGCSSLRTNYIGGNIEWIGYGAFKNCTSIQTMLINPKDKNLEIRGFEGCTNLESVTINNTVSTIGGDAFKGCSKLKSFTAQGYGNKLTIGGSAFEDCKSLKQFDFPTTETTIGDRAFYGCSEFKYIHLYASTTAIGASAFAQCTNLTCIVADMPNPIKINQNVFEGVDKNACVLYVPEGKYQPYWLADVWGDFANIVDNNNGLVYNEMFNVTVKTPGTLNELLGSMKNHISRLTLSGTLNIWDIQCLREMAGCYYNANRDKYNGTLSELNLQKANYEGNNSHINIYRSTGDTMDMYITSEGNEIKTGALFAYLDALQVITLPENVSSTGNHTLLQCHNLRVATIPEGVKEIGESSFARCDNMQHVFIPSTLKTINLWGFSQCSSLENIILPSGLKTIGDRSFSGCSNLTSIKVPESVTAIGLQAFYDCSSLTEINIPSCVSEIRWWTFWGCRLLREVVISSDNITVIPTEAFADSNVDKIKLPANLEYIGERAFIGACYLGTSEGLTIPIKGERNWLRGFLQRIWTCSIPCATSQPQNCFHLDICCL